jgi:hypothetical protein
MDVFRAALTVASMLAILFGIGMVIGEGNNIAGVIVIALGVGGMVYTVKVGPV